MGNKFILLFAFVFAIAIGCNDFSKLQKSTDLSFKYDRAVEYFNKGDFVKAEMLFDELYAVLRSTDKAENVSYYLSYCKLKLGDYGMASYLFKNYFKSFPTSARAAECLYMSAYCHYEISPPWSLDQSDTYSAIEEFQYFLQMFPSDTARLRECNKLVDLLHKKLEKKAYKTAVMYYDIAEYKAAIAAFDLVLHNYPDTRYREEAIFYILESKYYLAANSVSSKQEERIGIALLACSDFLIQYEVSEYTFKVKSIQNKALKLNDKILKNNKLNKIN